MDDAAGLAGPGVAGPGVVGGAEPASPVGAAVPEGIVVQAVTNRARTTAIATRMTLAFLGATEEVDSDRTASGRLPQSAHAGVAELAHTRGRLGAAGPFGDVGQGAHLVCDHVDDR